MTRKRSLAQMTGSKVLLEQKMLADREVWDSKPTLRCIYETWYTRVHSFLKPGLTLEVGAGTGNFKSFMGEVCISSDVTFAPWLDCVCDAMRFPIRGEACSNVVCFDLIHHLSEPMQFFSECLRVLTPAGRLIAVEPYLSAVGLVARKFCHHEDISLQKPSYPTGTSSGKNPLDANLAIPTDLFEWRFAHFARSFPEFRLIRKELFEFFAYPLSGGFHRPSLISPSWLKYLYMLERRLAFLRPLLAFKILVVLEKGP